MRVEIPNTENDEQIASLLGGLKRVEAPENFEFGVKARIAAGEPKESSHPFAVLKIAVPALALMSLAVFLYMSGFMSGDLPVVEVTDQTPNPTVVSESPLVKPYIASKEAVKGEREDQIASANTPAVNRIRSLPADRERRSKGVGGSMDQTSNPAPPIQPEGGRARRADEVLSMVGINTALRNDRFVANSVAGGSPAERIGVKNGDVILTLNDIPMLKSTTIKGAIELKSIRVDRAGRNIKLTY